MKMKKACEFTAEARALIKNRDRGCIFCQMGYDITPDCGYGLQIMHYIPRSHGGRGTERNGALGCLYHHDRLDNSDKRPEMIALFRKYLEEHYPDWNEKECIYTKWRYEDE